MAAAGRRTSYSIAVLLLLLIMMSTISSCSCAGEETSDRETVKSHHQCKLCKGVRHCSSEKPCCCVNGPAPSPSGDVTNESDNQLEIN
uniref:Bowman-Birk serine protease inhibitors family domain-containing protein n=1 Tax=Oryza brachyantha TaxID=4533 RepID=J3NA75_ORYBR